LGKAGVETQHQPRTKTEKENKKNTGQIETEHECKISQGQDKTHIK